MTTITIEQAGKYDTREVTIQGWLYNLRESGKLLFPIFRDGTGVIQGVVSLKENHDPTNKFIQAIRTRMQHDFVGVGVWFPPADMVAQILNFGLPAPIDVQITGADQEANFQFATNLMNQIRKIPGTVDFRIQEPNNAPELDITMDRTKASILGINAQSVANTVLGALAG